jgi:uncharacterized cupredoxin-like copper-binding protein
MMRAPAIALLVAATVAAAAFTGCGSSEERRATIGIRFSKFESAPITVRAGEPVRITLRNDDPIEHEWIVGTEEVHARHRTGTEPYHDAVPSEVTVPALESRETLLTFHEPGVYAYICHLPGHEDYGMTGTLRVVAS